jgi:hypothetical protein
VRKREDCKLNSVKLRKYFNDELAVILVGNFIGKGLDISKAHLLNLAKLI